MGRLLLFLFTFVAKIELNNMRQTLLLFNASLFLFSCFCPLAARAVDFVDLGLPSKTLWANMNVGATSPEDPGLYLAWGETEAKSEYSWATYKWCDGTKSIMTKYVSSADHGEVDGKYFLDAEDDAAADSANNIGSPTVEELSELLNDESLTWTIDTVNSRKCVRVTGANGNFIQIPAGGFKTGTRTSTDNSACCLWSNGLTTTQASYYYNANVIRLGIKSSGVSKDSRDHNGAGFVPRNYGYNIRAVKRPDEDTGAAAITADSASPVVGIYNVQGAKLSRLMPGINIVIRANGSASKMFVPAY